MEKIKATTHYSDYTGNISLDKNDLKNPFFKLAEDKNIDLTDKFLLAIKYKSHQGTKSQELIFYITDIAKDYEEVKKYLNENGKIPVEKVSISMDIYELLEYTKNFEFIYTFNDELIGCEIEE